MLVSENLVSPFKFDNEKDETLMYLVLSVVSEENGKDLKIWDTTVGRTGVFEEINKVFREYGIINLFKTNIISNKTKTITHAISGYTFIRRFITTDESFKEMVKAEWAIETVEELNEFLFSEYGDILSEMGIENDNDLTAFYKADWAHKAWRKDGGNA